MVAWKRICCPIDLSEPSHAGLRVAADLCRRLGSELVILYVEPGGKIAAELPPAGPVEEKLQAWKQESERLGAAMSVVARTVGSPEVAIVEFANLAEVDLIVMGTHGRVDREHMLTGSVTEGVLRTATCPVLAVRATWKRLEGAVE
jgi:nucleotide-binding universal stress UspA family protein